MQKQWLLVIGISLIILITILFSILLIQSPSSSPRKIQLNQFETLEGCNSLIYNSPSSTNLVFFSNEEQAEKYSNQLLNIAPLNDNQKSFNIYYIDTYVPDCTLYQGIATFCHSSDLIKEASSCPNDYIIVLDDEPPSIRSSAFQNVLSININHPLSVLTHEFGHAFANLAEEYVPATLQPGAQNCKTECSQFEPVKDGCFQGCSSSDKQRSIDAGVMRTLSTNNFGLFNEYIIEQRIDASQSRITGQAIEDPLLCENQNHIQVQAFYNNSQNTISQISKSIQQGCVGGPGFGNFIYFISDKQGKIITQQNFNANLVFTDAPNGTQIEGEIYPYSGPFILKIPKENTNDLLFIQHIENTTEIKLNDAGARPCHI
jgi:hypothetical protein